MTVRQIARIGIPFVVSGVFYSISLEGSFRTFQDTWFFHLGPGDSPPWYFIGSHLLDALWSLPCALVLIAFSFLTARKLGPTVWSALGVSLVSFSRPICEGVNILLHTRYVWDSARATSTWMSFDSYVQSQDVASTVSLVAFAPLMLWCFVRYARELKAQGTL
jgi:hypothetical protein